MVQIDPEYKDKEIDDIFKLQTDYISIYGSQKAYTLFAQIIFYFDNTIISVEHLYSDKKETNLIFDFLSETVKKIHKTLFSNHLCLDEYTVDHLIIFMALAKGKSSICIGEISTHSLTALEIVKKFIPGIMINIQSVDDYNVIEIEGNGWANEII